MKKFVRVVTVMLVLVMTVSMLAIPAAAATAHAATCSAEAVEPRGPVLYCSCGGYGVAHAQKLINGAKCWVAYCEVCGELLWDEV